MKPNGLNTPVFRRGINKVGAGGEQKYSLYRSDTICNILSGS